MKAIRYKNRAELFVLNGNKRSIRYEFHNGVKPNRYNRNMVLLKLHFGIGVRKFAAYRSPQGYAYACLKIM